MHCTAHDNSYRQDERWQPMGLGSASLALPTLGSTIPGSGHILPANGPIAEPNSENRTDWPASPPGGKRAPNYPQKNRLPLSRFVSNLDLPSDEPIHHLLNHGPSRWRQRNAREGLGKCASIFPLRLWRRLSFVGHTNATRSKIHRIFEQGITGAR